MAGLHVSRPRRIVRTAPAVLVVLPVPQCVKRLLPSRSRDIQALAGLKIAARRQDMHVDTPARFAVLDRCPGVAVRFEARPGGFLELVHHSADLRIARVVLRCLPIPDRFSGHGSNRSCVLLFRFFWGVIYPQ